MRIALYTIVIDKFCRYVSYALKVAFSTAPATEVAGELALL